MWSGQTRWTFSYRYEKRSQFTSSFHICGLSVLVCASFTAYSIHIQSLRQGLWWLQVFKDLHVQLSRSGLRVFGLVSHIDKVEPSVEHTPQVVITSQKVRGVRDTISARSGIPKNQVCARSGCMLCICFIQLYYLPHPCVGASVRACSYGVDQADMVQDRWPNINCEVAPTVASFPFALRLCPDI